MFHTVHTDHTALQYACYLKKFAVFVGQTCVLNAGIYADKSFFTDENILVVFFSSTLMRRNIDLISRR